MSKYYEELLELAEKEEEKVRKLLIQNYVSVLADIKRKLKVYIMDNENLTFAKQLELKRLDNLINQINIVLNKLYDNNYKIITDYDRETMEREYFGVFYEVENLAKIDISFSMLNERYIQEAIEFPVDGFKLSERLYDKYLMDMKYRVKGAVTQGLINSSGYVAIAKTISDIGFTNFEHAMTIAITEAGRMKSLARQKGQKEALDKGVKLEKKWVSVLDKKTRHSHQKLDGQIVPIDGEFESNGHKAPQPRLFGVASEDIRCRCDTLTIVEGISPDLRKDNETKQYIEYQNYEDWYKNRFGTDYFKGGYRYSKDGIMKVTDDWKGQHKTIPRKYKPNAVIETSTEYKNGYIQIDRTLYDKNGMMNIQIHSGNHNKPKQHPYGVHGEHMHIYEWDKDGNRKSRDTMEITEKYIKENIDILRRE